MHVYRPSGSTWLNLRQYRHHSSISALWKFNMTEPQSGSYPFVELFDRVNSSQIQIKGSLQPFSNWGNHQ